MPSPKKLLITFFLLLCSSASLGQVVIANKDTTPAALSINVVRSIFLMRLKEWEDGNQIVVYVLKDNNDTHVNFCRNTLGLFPYQLQQAWDRLVFSGIGQSPIILTSEKELIEKVANTPGAIGYASHIPEKGEIKVVEVKHGS